MTPHAFPVIHAQTPGEIDIFVREVVSTTKKGQDLPCLLFLAGR